MAYRLYLTLTCLLAFYKVVPALHPLRAVYEWPEIDFEFDQIVDRNLAVTNGVFIPKNNVPFGLEVYKKRVFLTIPRWKKGVPASLAYFDLTNQTETERPLLKPYPSWAAHNILNEQDAELVSPFRVRADQCGRLWVLDSRISGVLELTKIYGPAQLLVYDLRNDNLLRRHVFPANHMKDGSFFASLVIDDTNCLNSFAYAGDLGNPGLVVYSWNAEDSWRVQHNFFHPDPLAGNFSINNINFQWDDGLYGLALSKARSPVTLYFHPLSSSMEFMVDTRILQNKTKAISADIYYEFKILGSRGVNAQAGASVIDKNTSILFYALPNKNAIGCWQTTSDVYKLSPENIISDPVDLSFPSDVTVDEDNQLWILSNRLPQYLYGEFNENAVNYRILKASINELIQQTTCGIENKPFNNNTTNVYEVRSRSTAHSLQQQNIFHFLLLSVSLPLFIFSC